MHNEGWEYDLSYILKDFITDIKKVDIDSWDEQEKIANEYAHRINLWTANSEGDIVTFDKFKEYVRHRFFIDSDGIGYFIDNNSGDKLFAVCCDENWLIENKPTNSDYIMWYNK